MVFIVFNSIWLTVPILADLRAVSQSLFQFKMFFTYPQFQVFLVRLLLVHSVDCYYGMSINIDD